MKRAGQTTIVIGRQCGPPVGNLTRLLLENYDRGKQQTPPQPLWELVATQARPVHELPLGQVPQGYVEEVNNFATQKIGKTLSVTVRIANHDFNGLFDRARLREGKVLAANHDVLSETEFRKRFGCK
jgi:hypothetical protein